MKLTEENEILEIQQGMVNLKSKLAWYTFQLILTFINNTVL